MADTLLEDLTVAVPYYRQPLMLKRQLEEWNKYPERVRIVLVDDGSPEAAEPIVKRHAHSSLRSRLEVYRTDVDIPWTREFARNLAAKVASTRWILQIDIDHIAPAESVAKMLETPISSKNWYRFRRMRVGKADETRKKDALDPHCELGEVHPHIDSYLCQGKHFWKAGGYNEKFCGVLGGGNEFLRRFEAAYPVAIFPGDVFLHVYTRNVIRDSSDWVCSRDTKPGKDLWRRLKSAGELMPKEWLTLPWSRVL